MDETAKKVVFASDAIESAYAKLSVSPHPEDRRLYAFLNRVREWLSHKYKFGKRVSLNDIPNIYRRFFNIDNLWKIGAPTSGEVWYSLAGNEIKIVDIV